MVRRNTCTVLVSAMVCAIGIGLPRDGWSEPAKKGEALNIEAYVVEVSTEVLEQLGVKPTHEGLREPRISLAKLLLHLMTPGKVELVARTPKLHTLDGEKADLSVGERID